MSEVKLSAHGEKAKSYYDQGRWNIEMLRNVTRKGWIAKAEFEAITGEKA